MTSTVSLYEESKNQNGFYVPRFEVRIEGEGLPSDVLRDLIQVTYEDSIQKIDGFELTVNNWDPSTNDFKYVGSETAQSLEGNTPESRRYRLFEPCNKQVKVSMGYAGALRVMLTGHFTTIEPNFPSSGAPTLTVRGLNVLHSLRRASYTQPWEGRRDSEIAEEMARQFDRARGQKRFPIPIRIDANAQGTEPVLEYVAQTNQYDIDFLLARARVRGYVVFVQEANRDGDRSAHELYFGPSHVGMIPGLRDVTFELEWGKSLIDFKPTLSTANQVVAVHVRGWDRRKRREIVESATLSDLSSTGNRDLYRLLGCDQREIDVVDEPVFTEQQARQRALAILRERQKEMVKATGTTVGLPDLRAGQRVMIKGIGARFSGIYFVTDTTHTIGENGYTTRFSSRREDAGG